MPLTLAGHDIICISCTAWDAHWSTQHQVIWRLAETNRILFVELPISPLSSFTGLTTGTLGRTILKWRHGGLREEKRNLFIATPPPVLPFRYHKVTNGISQSILARFTRGVASRLSFKDPLVLTFQADSAVLVRRLSASARVYYCADDWASLDRWWQPPDRVRAREMELVDSCDLVVATSQRLARRFERSGKPTMFLPNAADYALFSRWQGLPSPKEIRGRRRPVVGFSGMIHRHGFDADLVRWLGLRRPDWTFLIVGKEQGSEQGLKELKRLPNFIFAGFQPLAVLPAYVAAMDVCMIPRPQTEWARNAFSLKLFEYLAVGKPVVTTWTEEYVPYEDLLYQATSYEEFERCVERAIAENCEELAHKRMVLASENSWENRVARLSQMVNEFLARKPGAVRDAAAESRIDIR